MSAWTGTAGILIGGIGLVLSIFAIGFVKKHEDRFSVFGVTRISPKSSKDKNATKDGDNEKKDEEDDPDQYLASQEVGGERVTAGYFENGMDYVGHPTWSEAVKTARELLDTGRYRMMRIDELKPYFNGSTIVPVCSEKDLVVS